MANANVVPPDAEKLLFAVDVVSFFLTKHNPQLSFAHIKTDIVNQVNCYRSLVRQLFNANVEKIMADIDETQSVIVRRDFSEIQNRDGLNACSLIDYSSLFKDCYLSKDFQAGRFLIYCARIALMAYFYYTKGCNDALDVALDLIKTSFPDDEEKFNLISDDLESAALKYAKDTPGDAASFLFRRDPRDPVSSETEESSNSSTVNSESESVVETQKMSSDSSAESLTALVIRLNASAAESTEDQCKSCAPIIPEVIAENVKSDVEYPSSSLNVSDAPKCSMIVRAKIEKAFKEVEAESTQSRLVVQSPRKSCLGKRPSPRKDSSDARSYSDSETEVKRPKLRKLDFEEKKE